jgi:hypothetical protein
MPGVVRFRRKRGYYDAPGREPEHPEPPTVAEAPKVIRIDWNALCDGRCSPPLGGKPLWQLWIGVVSTDGHAS